MTIVWHRVSSDDFFYELRALTCGKNPEWSGMGRRGHRLNAVSWLSSRIQIRPRPSVAVLKYRSAQLQIGYDIGNLRCYRSSYVRGGCKTNDITPLKKKVCFLKWNNLTSSLFSSLSFKNVVLKNGLCMSDVIDKLIHIHTYPCVPALIYSLHQVSKNSCYGTVGWRGIYLACLVNKFRNILSENKHKNQYIYYRKL